VRERLDERRGGDRRAWVCALAPFVTGPDPVAAGAHLTSSLIAGLVLLPLGAIGVWFLTNQLEPKDRPSRSIAIEASNASRLREPVLHDSRPSASAEATVRVPAASVGGLDSPSTTLLDDMASRAPGNRMAERASTDLIVVDVAGSPIGNADIALVSHGVGTTGDAVASGESSWRTDASGQVRVDYPAWASAEVRTNRLQFRVTHDDFASSVWQFGASVATQIRPVVAT
jgi:hypothetical protein